MVNTELNKIIENIIEKNDGLWKCKVCGKITRSKTKIGLHAETHFEGMSHICQICSKSYQNRASLKKHISDIHSKLSSCDVCEKSEMSRKSYRNHKQKCHI